MSREKRPPASEDERLGRALALLREDRGLTQEEAAAAAGLKSTQAWQNYEAGKRRWKPALRQFVTRALGATEADLLARLVDVPFVQQPAGGGGGVSERPHPPALVGVMTTDGIVHLRRFRYIEGGKLFASGVNDDQVHEYDLDQVRSVHTVAG